VNRPGGAACQPARQPGNRAVADRDVYRFVCLRDYPCAPSGLRGAPFEEVRFALDSPVEERGFELLVPP